MVLDSRVKRPPQQIAQTISRLGVHFDIVDARLGVHPDGKRLQVALSNVTMGSESTVRTLLWHASIGGATLADAILDRLMHNAHRIELKGTSMRKKMSRLDSK